MVLGFHCVLLGITVLLFGTNYVTSLPAGKDDKLPPYTIDLLNTRPYVIHITVESLYRTAKQNWDSRLPGHPTGSAILDRARSMHHDIVSSIRANVHPTEAEAKRYILSARFAYVAMEALCQASALEDPNTELNQALKATESVRLVYNHGQPEDKQLRGDMITYLDGTPIRDVPIVVLTRLMHNSL